MGDSSRGRRFRQRTLERRLVPANSSHLQSSISSGDWMRDSKLTFFAFAFYSSTELISLRRSSERTTTVFTSATAFSFFPFLDL